jgi:phosphoribosylformylglycinamidine synthase PurS subunit
VQPFSPSLEEIAVARVVVDVMLKPEILDPQGQAVLGAIGRMSAGGSSVVSVRQGKHFEIEVEGEVGADSLAQIRELAATLLSNPVIEDFALHSE